jgi:hypothetical protein
VLLKIQLCLIFSSTRPKIGDNIIINVKSTGLMTDFFCVVFQGSKIVYEDHLVFGIFKEDVSEISFKATQDMKPLVNVVVYYIHENGEIIYDAVVIDFREESKNFVSFFFLMV